MSYKRNPPFDGRRAYPWKGNRSSNTHTDCPKGTSVCVLIRAWWPWVVTTIQKKKKIRRTRPRNRWRWCKVAYQVPLFSIERVGELAAFTQGEIADTWTKRTGRWEITLITSFLVLLGNPYHLYHDHRIIEFTWRANDTSFFLLDDDDGELTPGSLMSLWWWMPLGSADRLWTWSCSNKKYPSRDPTCVWNRKEDGDHRVCF